MHRSIPSRPIAPARGWLRRRARGAAAAAVAALLLSACGFIAAFVPPIEVGDPLGVHGTVVTAALRDGGITTQSVSHVDTTRTFDVPDLDATLHGFSLASFHTNVGLTNEVRLSDPALGSQAEYPASITITRALIEAELWDDVNGVVTFAQDIALTLRFERGACAADGCTYVSTASGLADVLDVEVTDRDTLERLVAILTLGANETPNQGTFRVAIELEADPALTGFVATFHLTSTGSTIRLGG